ncbi:MAG TPA: hypothetical protein VIK69_08440, partial [Methylophilaceae bacterium]
MNFKLRGSAMANHGLGNCKHKPAWVYYGMTRQRECRKFVKADEGVGDYRREWLTNQRGGSNGR